MPLYDHHTFGDVQKYEYFKGVITSIDLNADTCIVSIGEEAVNAIVYYH